MTCCLNPACHNPSHSEGVNFCSNCGFPLVVLRNRYRPIKSLGGGGFGKTYLAADIDKLNELCVIKQFAPKVQGTNALNKATQLFEQEAKRLQQLGKHPQIPTLLAYFNEDNNLYLVQEFIEGENLLQELKEQGNFSENKIRDLLLDLLEILTIVHQEKVIHRDIKPENIIRRSDGKLVLIDFGASKQLTATVMTQVGTAIGSFGYAPLEQMQEGKVYPASDLYSVGATCFHLLSGIHPWELWKLQGYGWVSNWRKYLQPSISLELGEILDKLLSGEYQQRYQSAAEVLQILKRSPVIVQQNVTTTANLPLNHKKLLLGYLLFVPLIFLIGTGAIYIISIRSDLKVEQKSAESLYQEGLEKYNQKNFRGAIADYTTAIKINTNYAEAYYKRGNAHAALGEHQSAITDYTQAITINPKYTDAYINRGASRADLGDHQTAIADYNQAIQLNPTDADAHNNLGNAHAALGNNQAAIKDYTQAIQLNPNYALAYYNRGVARSSLGNKQAAIDDYTQAIKININYAQAYYNRGVVRATLGDRQAAINDYTQAIKINPNYADAYINRGVEHYKLGNRQAAITDYTQAIKINSNYADAYINRGVIRYELGDKQTAVEDFRKAADLYKQQGKERDYQDAISRLRDLY